MRLRLILQPAWMRFTVWAAFLAAWWALFTSLQAGNEFESTVLSAIVFGGALGAYLTVATQGMHRAALVAVSGLNQSERSEAINAVLRGLPPADPDVRASAARLGRAYLRNKSPIQLRRTQIWSWITIAALIAAGIAGAIAFSDDRLCFVVLVVLAAAVLPLLLIDARRVQRNVAQLAQTPA